MNLLRAGGWRGPRVGVPSAPPRPPPPRAPGPGPEPDPESEPEDGGGGEVAHASPPTAPRGEASPPTAPMGRPAIQGFQLPEFYHRAPSDGEDDADDEGDGPPDWRPSGPPVDRDRVCEGGQFTYRGRPAAEGRLVAVDPGEDEDPELNPWRTTLVPKPAQGPAGGGDDEGDGGDGGEQALIQSMLAGGIGGGKGGGARGDVSPYFSDGAGRGRRAPPPKRKRPRPRPARMYKEPLPGGAPMDRGQESSTYETDAPASKRRRGGGDDDHDDHGVEEEEEAREGEEVGVSGFTIDGRREEEAYLEAEEEEEERRAEERRLERLRALSEVRAASASPPPAGGGAPRSGGVRSILGPAASRIHTDCCRDADGRPLYERDTGREIPAGDRTRVWCFGCQWGAHNHRPVDKDKIDALASTFMNLILNASTTLENVGHIISEMYRQTIREPAAARGQWLPDWPPEVVQRHIENMTEPRVVNALLIRTHLSLTNRLAGHTFRVDMRTGEEEVNLQAIRVWCAMLKETRTLYAQVPKEAFGYNEMLRAESWAGGTLVHPTRIRAESRVGSEYAGAPALGENKLGGGRGPAVAEGGADTGDLRGPANDEELLRRPTGYGMGLPQ